MPLYIVREGDGEEEALPALVYRLGRHLGLTLPFHHPKKHGLQLPLLTKIQVQTACDRLRSRADCEALLLTRDADQDQLAHADCPKFSAPALAGWVQELDLPFPTAIILFYKEYETLFIAGATALAGYELRDHRSNVVGQIPDNATSLPDPELPRDAKGWVRANLVTAYKPTLHQTSLTRLLDLEMMQASKLSSYRRLTNALRFLADNPGRSGVVYPPAPIGGPG
jgi:hypothetical protein